MKQLPVPVYIMVVLGIVVFWVLVVGETPHYNEGWEGP
jgi:hypothetical protein